MEFISEKLFSTYRIITRRWSIHILFVLSQGPKRFKDIYEDIIGLSETMLAKRLEDLQNDKLITKQLDPQELHVTYLLTEKGRSLSSFIPDLIKWDSSQLPIVGEEQLKNKEDSTDGASN